MLTEGLGTRLADVLLGTPRDRDARALPVVGLVALAGSLPRDGGVTIDFASVEQLGQPLVVLRPAAAKRSQRFDALTPREREVAACVAAGLPNREIAARLWLTTATVKDHVHRILTKTRLPNRAAVAGVWNREQSFTQ